MGLSQRSYLTPPMQSVPLVQFAATNVAASSTDLATVFSVAALGGGASHRFWTPMTGAVITGMSMTIDTVGSHVGTLTIQIFVDTVDAGAAYDLVFDPTATGNQAQATRYASPLVIAAPVLNAPITSPRIDLRATTTADWGATGGDVNVWLWGYLLAP
jgi:hypothetical protein